MPLYRKMDVRAVVEDYPPAKGEQEGWVFKFREEAAPRVLPDEVDVASCSLELCLSSHYKV